MELTYNEVPEIITEKDLDYLCDMFNSNYGCLKFVNNAITNMDDEDLININEKAFDLFENNLNTILDILEGGYNENSES